MYHHHHARWAARERGGPLPSISVADALLDAGAWVLIASMPFYA